MTVVQRGVGAPDPVAPLVQHLVATTGLDEAEARRVVGDVVAFHRESVEDYVRRRHAALQLRGLRNPEIFARVAAELAERVVAPPTLSERQLRRMIYG
ncbi:hypothetical protein BKA08_001173 [Nocardioides marinisabuli]|uniref:Uncharacterized protein n=1 Tax=Nocardioides marinisabuli TaxID=419476 RepID=A0A7Y9JQ00_9ACTN|nr:hypothetical protein [Nocardioides marinisabuli]NYD56935.1 hypothetical protein [Nocardioides marinisabuli]